MWDDAQEERNPSRQRHTYLTAAAAAKAEPGTVWQLGYDDVNRGKFIFTVLRRVPGRQGEIRLEGMLDYGPDDEPPFKGVIYQLGDTMCRGSGGERLYLYKGRKLKKHQ